MTVDAAADAYVWGYPLVAMHRTRARHGRRARGALVARAGLSTAADRTVVAPNDDTLYSTGWFDLGRGDVTVEVGAMDPDRYWSVMLLDAYTNVAYVCRRLHGSGGARVRVTWDPATHPASDRALDVVPMGTPTLWVLARVLVDGPDDLDAARAAQSAIQLHQPAAVFPDAAAPPAPDGPLGAGEGTEHTAPTTTPLGSVPDGGEGAERAAAWWFAELGEAVVQDPPAAWHPQQPAGLAALLGDPPPAAVLAEGVRRGKDRIAAQGLGADRTANGWGTRSRGADFGDDVTYRAGFAKVSLAGHQPAENRAYSRVIDGSRPVTLRFPPGGEPPVGGFWSLTLYGPDMFFVENELGRYSVGDRMPGLQRDGDGSLAIAIGSQRPAEPARAANWLPAPAGPCVLALRAYEGAPAVVDATWFPPDLTPGAA